MRNKLIRISGLGVLFVLFAFPSFSQYNTFSPYTRFGLGDITHGGFGQNQAMGGTGIALKEGGKLNYLNPAAYAARDSMSVLFDFGLNVYRNKYSTNDLTTNWLNANLNHFALSAPIGKTFAMATGIVPYSSVGYRAKQEINDLGTGDAIDLIYSGDGGVLKYFLGTSVELFDRISVGVNMNYLLGSINRERSILFPRNRGFAETVTREEINISHTYLGFGFMYKERIKEEYYFSIGGNYEMETHLKSAFKHSSTSFFDGIPNFLDSTFIKPDVDITNSDIAGTINVPAKIGLGVSFGINNKLTVTGDYYIQNWETAENQELKLQGFNLANARSLHGGMEYTPDFEALRGYHNLMSYRIGAYKKDSYVKIGDYQLQDYGMTFGVGLPLGKTKSSVNLAFTYGTRGTTDYNLVKENYGILTFSLTLHDLWFYKRKFD